MQLVGAGDLAQRGEARCDRGLAAAAWYRPSRVEPDPTPEVAAA